MLINFSAIILTLIHLGSLSALNRISARWNESDFISFRHQKSACNFQHFNLLSQN
jgi:hypothetical protein